ncbi:MAG: helix-turn-helix transcriptional regulator [Gammaproteobacteria bacterium]|nr:helix-turn-helix transcriptional regulator [Gammaproteobacteria bacterium]MBU1978626.1 helix-turn-helix transcriptional regulator [Gammaproteobacteria bacterium]
MESTENTPDTPMKKARTGKNLTIYDVAKAVGLSASRISCIERGAPTSRDKVTAIARLLGITEEEVLYPERFIVKQAA